MRNFYFLLLIIFFLIAIKSTNRSKTRKDSFRTLVILKYLILSLEKEEKIFQLCILFLTYLFLISGHLECGEYKMSHINIYHAIKSQDLDDYRKQKTFSFELCSSLM